MVLWRISRHRDLRGVGGLKAAGRWHYAGHVLVYLTGTPASALLEVCVHTSANDVPPAFTLLKIEGPDVEVLSIKIDDLPQDWRARLEVTRDLRLGFAGNDSNVRTGTEPVYPRTNFRSELSVGDGDYMAPKRNQGRH
jgi:RES domain